MKERELQFDRSRHLIYSRAVRKVIQKHLAMHYSPEAAEEYWESIQKRYVKVLEEIPYMGGRQNSQAGAVYDCAALFCYYLVLPEKPTLEEFSAMNDELFLPVFRRMRFLNLNCRIFMMAADLIWSTLARKNALHREDWPGNYIMEMRSCPEGSKYVFLRCPIAELAKRLGLTHMMPAMCNPDYPMLHAIHGGLIRTDTCAKGACCDFWIVGDRSSYLKDHPRRQDKSGYWYND